jgi:hypothetical protein
MYLVTSIGHQADCRFPTMPDARKYAEELALTPGDNADVCVWLLVASVETETVAVWKDLARGINGA